MSNVMLDLVEQAKKLVDEADTRQSYGYYTDELMISLKKVLSDLESEITEYMFTCGDENGEIETFEDDDDQKRNDALKRGQLMEDNGGPYDNPNE